MSTLSISARPRAIHGRHLGALRREGMVPAIVYGHGQQPQSVETDLRSLERLVQRAGRTTLVDLETEGGATRKVLLREIQFNKRTGKVIHVDFFAPNLRVKTVGDVPIVLTGEAPAVELKLGVLLQVSSTIKVEALPRNLPTQLTADVSGLDAADAVLTAGELTLPGGVTLVSDPGEVVAKVAGRRSKGMEPGEGDEDDEGGESGSGDSSSEGATEHTQA